MKRSGALAVTLALAAGQAHAQVAADPQGSSPLVAALQWVQGTLLGNLATTAAVWALDIDSELLFVGDACCDECIRHALRRSTILGDRLHDGIDHRAARGRAE